MNRPPNSKTDISAKVETYEGRLRNFIRKRVRSSDDVEDILQEVMFQLVKADSVVQPIVQIEAWLYSVARSKIIDWSRKKKNLSLSELLTDEDDVSDEVSSILFEEASNPEEEYLQSLFWQELEKALSELPKEQSDVFRMNELEGVSFRDIAKQTGVSENTLISRKRYAVLYLRDKLRLLYYELLSS